MSVIDFMHGSSFANALNSITATHLQGMDIEYRKKVFEIIDRLKQEINNRNATIEQQNELAWELTRELDAGLGFIRLLEEENRRLQDGVLTENRLSGNDQLRINVRSELEKLSKVDRDLACTGGRFSGNRIHNLRDVLHMRIDEFCEYGVKHRLISPDFKTVYTAETPKKLYAFVDENKVTAGNSPDVVEVLILQRILNKNYDQAVDANGQRPDDYAFKPINLIAAVGFTVKQLCEFAALDGKPFVGHKYSDPAPIDYGRDKANDGAAALLQLEYKVLENEADEKIRKSRIDNPEQMIELINKTITDDKARTAAKISVVKYVELEQQLRPDRKPAGPGG